MKTAIINAKVICENQIWPGYGILVEDGTILSVGPSEQLGAENCDRVIDAQGAYASAGWIELHTHGIDGYDFMDAESEKIWPALQAYARHGVTGVFPTTMSAPFEEIRKSLDSFAAADLTACGGARFLGVHLEGPYFSPAQAGAQPPDKLARPSDREYEKLIEEYPFIARIDAAPELPGALDMPACLAKRGIVSGMAHTDASAAQVKAAADAGYTIATHLYSGMSVVHRINGYRHAGTVEGCFLRDDIYTEAICDGIHLPAELLQLIYKVKGPDRMILVSDSMRGAGMPEGTECMLGAKDTGTLVVVENGVAWMPDRQAFAGSVATYDRLIRTAVNYAGIPLTDAIKMATKTPAAVMGLQGKGQLRPGFDADVTVFDETIQVRLTMVGGNVVYAAKDELSMNEGKEEHRNAPKEKKRKVYEGVLIKESIADETILDIMNIHKTELWKTDDTPRYWTALHFSSEQADFPEQIARVMVADPDKGGNWYVDFKAGNEKYVVFKDKVLKYRIGNQAEKDFVCAECRKLGILERQLDWSE